MNSLSLSPPFPPPPPLLSSPLLLPALLLTQPSPLCPEVNPRNIALPLTSNPPSHSITTIIIKNNISLLLTLPILKTPAHNPSLCLTKLDQTWIWSQILSSSLLLLPSMHLPFVPQPALPSVGTQPSRSPVSQSRIPVVVAAVAA